MADALFVAGSVAFFILSALLIRVFSRL